VEKGIKSQVTLELIFAIGLCTIILASLFGISKERYAYVEDVGKSIESRMVGELIATAINNVHSNGQGFSITIPEEKLNYSKLSNKINLPIIISKGKREIIITRTGQLENLTTSIPILTPYVARENPTTFNETTFYNNGTYVVIYAREDHIRVVT